MDDDSAPMTPRERHEFERRTEAAYALLLRAYEHALDAGRDVWQFAIEVEELKALGLHEIDLAWLLSKDFARQAIETTVPGDEERSFRRLATRILGPHVHLALTPAGYHALSGQPDPVPRDNTTGKPDALARDASSSSPSPTHPLTPSPSPPVTLHPSPLTTHSPTPTNSSHDSDTTPVWDAEQRELRFRGQLVKRYKVPAPNQERILSAFQEEGWPHGIDDPLPPEPDQEPIRRLQATIKSLNGRQVAKLVRFRGNGNGDRVVWEVE